MLVGAGLTVVDAGLGVVAPPCVVWWPEPAWPTSTSLRPSDSVDVSWTTVAVGETADQVLWVTDRVKHVLHRAVVSVAGRATHPIRLEHVGPVQRDDDMNPPALHAAQRWTLRAPVTS